MMVLFRCLFSKIKMKLIAKRFAKQMMKKEEEEFKQMENDPNSFWYEGD